MSGRIDGDRPPATLVELLRRRAGTAPEQRAYSFLTDGEEDEVHLTHAELDRRARAIGATLRERAAPGARVVLLFPPGLDYIAAFFGCLYAGAIAVPAYPPDPARLQRTLPRLRAMVADAQARVVLTVGPIAAMAGALAGLAPDLAAMDWIATDELDLAAAQGWEEPRADGDQLAFLQYTSGSTGSPKGVMLSHANLLHNERLIKAGFGLDSTDLVFGWLPLYHDMGLIGNVLQPLYSGCRCVLMSPVNFLRRPSRWLRGVTRHRATATGGPNFAYELCVRKIAPEERQTLDLSSLAVAFNGAEPVRHDTMARFAEAFAPCGFRPEAFYPCYGLAEAALVVTGGERGAGATRADLDAAGLERRRVVEVEAEPEPGGARRLVGSGRVLGDQRLLIVDPLARVPLPPGHVGEVWVSGPSVARGYWNRPEATAETFGARLADTDDGPFLRTGNLGFLHRGQLFIAGRAKDMIIVRGRNHYPQDIERTVEESHGSIRRGCTAAFALEVGDEERLGVAVEVDARAGVAPDELVRSIRQAVTGAHEIQAHAVVLLPPGAVPKTSSGKIQRHACRQAFLDRTLAELTRDVLDDDDRAIEDAPAAPDLRALPPADRGAELLGYLQRRIAHALRLPAAAIAPDANVSALGIDSILAIELTHELEACSGAALPSTLFLRDASLADLAERVAGAAAAPPLSPSPAGEPAADPALAPLSAGQEALWFLHLLDPGSSAYNLASALRIDSPVNAQAMRSSWQILVERHAILRTTYAAGTDGPIQRIQHRCQVAFDAVDASAWSEEELRARLSAEAQRPFDLEQGPVLRVGLYTRSAVDHVLLASVHHIAADLWMLTMLLAELRELYPAACLGQPARLAVPARSYLDFVRGQAAWLAGPDSEPAWTYWQAQLAGPLPELALPADRPRPPQQRFRGASIRFELDEDLTRELQALAMAESTTPFVVLLAAFQLLLSLHTGQEDVIVGSPVSGRTRAGFEQVAGYFVNTVALRVDLSGTGSFRHVVARARRTVVDALEHQELPFSRLVDRLGVRRDASRSPVFQAMFALERPQGRDADLLAPLVLGAPGQVDLGGLVVQAVPLEERASQFDVTMTVVPCGRTMAAALQYDADLFDPATAERMVRHFERLLRQAVARPGAALGELALVDDAERALLSAWSQGAALPVDEVGVHVLFERQAARTPRAVAVEDAGSTLTFAELDDAAARLAERLRAGGVAPGDRVATLLDRSLRVPVALLAILKAGAVYVPLDASHPAERLAFLLRDAAAAALLVQDATRAAVTDFAGALLCLDGDDAGGTGAVAAAAPRPATEPDDAAYVLFTSGSTGAPKGVVVPHRGIAGHLRWMQATFPLAADDRVLQLTPATFDVSIWELLGPISAGARLVIAPPDVHRDSARLVALLAEREITALQTVPSMLRVLVDEPGFASLALRRVFCGGEAMPVNLPARVHGALPHVLLCNAYGPTEASIDATFWICEPTAASDASIPIGRPVANARAYVLDRAGRLQGIGLPGELCVGGRGVALGYLGRPELTRAAFVPDPFAGTGGAMYRTGDRARWRADGVLEFLGRDDLQVKLRGQRIELGEIEAALLRHPEVAAAAVAVHRGDSGERLVGYVVGRGGVMPEPESLRRFLRQRLPESMVPAVHVRLDALPVSAHGKLDRRALPPPPEPPVAGAGAGPRNDTERLVAAVCSEVLGRPVGRDDDFFLAGGHSLLATRVISRLRRVLHIDLPIAALFAAPTVAGLAAHIDATRRQAGQVEPIPRAPRTREMPVSVVQRRIFTIDRSSAGNPMYNMPAAIRLRGRLDAAALARAIEDLVRRHEVLRTTFRLGADGPVQTIHPPGGWTIPLEDLGHLPEAQRDAAVERLAREDALTPFDITCGPLLRARLLRRSDDHHVLLFAMHHIVSDGWSMAVLADELGKLYNGHVSGADPRLPPLELQYADYVAWQRAWMRSPGYRDQLGYWVGQLAEAPTLELPLDRERPPRPTFRGRHHRFAFDRELADALVRLGHRHGTTPFMTLTALFNLLLHSYRGQTDLCVSTTIAGRTRAELEPLIGFFINRLVLRLRLTPQTTFLQLLEQVRDTTLAGYAHQDVPFDRIIEALGVVAHPSSSPLCQAMFVLQNTPAPEIRLDQLTAELLEVATDTSKFDLAIVMSEEADGLAGFVEYKTDLFDESTIAAMVQRFERLARACAGSPQDAIERLCQQACPSPGDAAACG